MVEDELKVDEEVKNANIAEEMAVLDKIDKELVLNEKVLKPTTEEKKDNGPAYSLPMDWIYDFIEIYY